MTRRGWLLLGCYRLLALVLSPVWLALLLVRLAQGKEHPQRLVERLGWPTRRRPPGPVVWFHCASVGELNSLLPVFRELGARAESDPASSGPLPVLLVTTVTRTSAALAARVLPAGVIHQFVPIDHWLAMVLFRSYWRPCLGVLAEAELWPELVHAMPRLLLINARMSERSYQRHRCHRWYAAWLLSAVQVCLAQSQADAERFRRLGVRDVRALGSTKLDAAPLPVNAAHLSLLRQAFAGRPVLLLASSHPGEEQQWLEAWVRMVASGPMGLLLAPRHPQRAPGLRDQAAAQGYSVALWSELQAGLAPPHPDVLVADVIGEMGAWISAATVVVMGGSFHPMGQPHGGQNPLEPIALGRPVLCGPDMANFSDLLDPLIAAGCLQQHADVATTLEAALALLSLAPAQVDAAPPPLPVRPRLRGPSQLVATLVRERCR